MVTQNNEGGYPPGAEYDPRAPWNQEKVKYKDVDITVCVSLSKTVSMSLPEDYTEDDIIDRLSYCSVKKDLENMEKNKWNIDDYQIINEN